MPVDDAGRAERGSEDSRTPQTEIERCEAEQRRIESEGPGPLWLWVLGWADWEAEKELIRREKFH